MARSLQKMTLPRDFVFAGVTGCNDDIHTAVGEFRQHLVQVTAANE